MRHGFTRHWHALAAVVREVLAVPEGIVPDEQLQYPEQYRRLPNGGRIIGATKRKPKGKDGWIEVPFRHMLGIPYLVRKGGV